MRLRQRDREIAEWMTQAGKGSQMERKRYGLRDRKNPGQKQPNTFTHTHTHTHSHTPHD